MILQKISLGIGRPFNTRRFVKHLTAVGVLCFVVATAGCGGGGSGGGGGGGGKIPPVPTLPVIVPSTPTEAVNDVIANTDFPVTGVTITTLDPSISSDEIVGIVNQFTNPANIVLPQITSPDGKQGTFVGAAAAGVSQADLNTFFTTNYPLATIIKPGDQLQSVTVQLAGGQSLTTLAVVTPSGAIRFSPALSLIPGGDAYPGTETIQEVDSPNGKQALAVVTNRNPFTGDIIFQLPQRLSLDVDNGEVQKSLQFPEPTLGPGVVITSRSEPIFTETVLEDTPTFRRVRVTATVNYTYAIRIGNTTIAGASLKKIRALEVGETTVTVDAEVRVVKSGTGGGG